MKEFVKKMFLLTADLKCTVSHYVYTTSKAPLTMSQTCKEIMHAHRHFVPYLEVDKNNIQWNTVGILRNYISTEVFQLGAQCVQYRWETGVLVFLAAWAACPPPPGWRYPRAACLPGGKISGGIFTPTLSILIPGDEDILARVYCPPPNCFQNQINNFSDE